MRDFIAGLFLLFLSTPALADPPAPYEYIVSYKLGRGLPVCDAVFAQLINPRNELYLRYHAGAPVNDSGKGETDGMFSLTGDSPVSLPAWHWDKGNGETLLDLDGNNRKEKIYSTLGPLGDFPHLSMNDGSDIAAALASLKGSYIVNFEYRPYVIARQFGICEATVKVHVKAILRKLGVENRTQAATWGVKNGLGEPVQLNLREVRPARALPRLSPVTGRAA